MLSALRSLASRWPYAPAPTIVGILVLAYAGAGLLVDPMGWSSRWGVLTTPGHRVAGALDPSFESPLGWTTLITACFLHGGLMHLGMNSMSLLSLGRLLDALTMPRNTVLSFLVGCLGSSAGVLIAHAMGFSSALTIGASGGVCGVLGCLLGLLYKARGEAFAYLRSELVFSTVTLLAIGFLPGISASGHLGGLVSGILLGLVLRQRGGARFSNDLWTSIPDVVTAALVALFVVALTLGGLRSHHAVRLFHDGPVLIQQFEKLHAWTKPGAPLPSREELEAWLNIDSALKPPAALLPIQEELRKSALSSGLFDAGLPDPRRLEETATAVKALTERLEAVLVQSGWWN